MVVVVLLENVFEHGALEQLVLADGVPVGAPKGWPLTYDVPQLLLVEGVRRDWHVALTAHEVKRIAAILKGNHLGTLGSPEEELIIRPQLHFKFLSNLDEFIRLLNNRQELLGLLLIIGSQSASSDPGRLPVLRSLGQLLLLTGQLLKFLR